MVANISTNQEEDYLLIKTSGTINGWIEFTKQLYEEITECNCNKTIIDHRELEFPDGLMHYVDLVGFYAENLPFDIRFLKVAVVINTKYEEVGHFWETYCHNRGFRYRAFTSMEDAKIWIRQQK